MRCRDGLRLPFPPGQPIDNVATIDGATNFFCDCRELEVSFTAVESAPFRRCDANDDARLDIGDPIFTLNWLFLGGSAPPCRQSRFRTATCRPRRGSAAWRSRSAAPRELAPAR
ncbi:MAG: hypothetical protein O7J95_02790 [Planctomycetota bacterium]|nr:hypothetical protein [Planctomycetota bacterium]